MRSSRLLLSIAGMLGAMALAAAACVSNDNATPAGLGDAGPGLPGVDGSSPGDADDGSVSHFDAATSGDSGPSGSDSGPSGGDAGTLLDGSAEGGVSFGTALAPALYMAASDDGSAMLISAPDGPPEAEAIRFSHFEPGHGWTTPADVPGTLSWEGGGPPVLGIDGSGNAFLAWTTVAVNDAGVGIYNLLVSRYDHATSTWSTPLNPDSYAEATSSYIAMDVSPGGTAIIQSDHLGATAAHSISVVRYASGAWTEELAVARNSAFTDTPTAVRVLDDGRAAVLWTGNAGDGVATRDTNGVWTANADLNAISTTYATAVGLDNAGNAVVPFANSSPEDYVYDPADGGWSAPMTIPTAAVGTQFGFSATMNATTGDAVLTHGVVLADGGQVAESVVYTGASKTWETPQPLALGGQAGNLAVKYDSTNDALALWFGVVAVNGTTVQVHSSTYTQAGGWGATSGPLSDSFPVGSQSLAPALSPSGAHAWAAWTENGAAFVQKLQ